eukprot:6367740-Amphidinium_carterae.2
MHGFAACPRPCFGVWELNMSNTTLRATMQALRHELLAERSRTQDALEAAAQAARRHDIMS